MNKKRNIIKVFCIILILLIFYAIEYYMLAEKYDTSYTVLMLLIESEAFIVGVFFSVEHIKKMARRRKDKNKLYLCDFSCTSYNIAHAYCSVKLLQSAQSTDASDYDVFLVRFDSYILQNT